MKSLVSILMLMAALAFTMSTSAATADAGSSKGKAYDKTTSQAKVKSTKKSTNKAKKALSGKLNINTASAAALTALPGIGEKKAKAIVAYRKKNGKFKSVNDLTNVKGIGDKMVKKLKSAVKLK